MANTSVLQMTADLTASTTAGAVSQLLPSGTVLPFAGKNVPAGWLLCDGSEVSKQTYSDLFSAVLDTDGVTGVYDTQVNPATGSAYAAPSAGNFRLPDYRGMFLRGAGTASGGDATAVGGHQAQKTAKNGLAAPVSVSGSRNQMNRDVNGVDINHWHGIGTDGNRDARRANDHNWNAYNNPPGFVPIDDYWTWENTAPNHSHGGGTGWMQQSWAHAHSLTYDGSFSASGSPTISGDTETRPVNKGINYIIKV